MVKSGGEKSSDQKGKLSRPGNVFKGVRAGNRVPMKRFTAPILALTFALLCSLGLAQNEVRFQLVSGQTQVEAGTHFTLVLKAEISEGWHLYSMTPYPEGAIAPQPTTVILTENDFFTLAGAVKQPNPKISFDENFGIDTEYFEGLVDFEIPVLASATASGTQNLAVKVRFMACNDRLCLPPQNEILTAAIEILPGSGVSGSAAGSILAAPEEAAGSGAPVAQISAPSNGLPSGTLAYILFAMAGGGLALLTPCVFPMIPITVSYFTKREVSRQKALGEAALYSLGIIGTFTLLGFLLTALFGAGGINRVATSPTVNILIALIFIVFALSLFGVIELRVPSGLLSALDKKSSASGGVWGILLMALTFSLTSFTCTVPFVGTVMVAATQGSWLWSLLGVTAFATVFALPFFFLALFPSWLKSLPKSGGWMDSMKITMGFLELAAAMKFISNVDLVYQWELITRPVFITIWLAISLMTAIYLLGKFYFPHEVPPTSLSAGRVMSAAFFLAVSFYLLRGLIGFPLGELDAFLPPRDYGGMTASFGVGGNSGEKEEAWMDDYQEALQVAKLESKPVFVDFTGYTCTNCRWMESNIFPRTAVRELFAQYVLVRLYTDGGGPEHEANLKFERDRFGTIALPLYALVSPQDEILATFPGLTRSEDEFVAFLASGLPGGRADLAGLQ